MVDDRRIAHAVTGVSSIYHGLVGQALRFRGYLLALPSAQRERVDDGI